jgi:hypothetical protein
MRAIEPIEAIPDFAEAADRAGPAPQLQWIEIARLRVDETYQRQLTKAGRANIARIAANFRWHRFAPVVVSPVPGGFFAIVDGQHRTTAAATIGIEAVPCQVIMADRREQADAFRAINGDVTRIHKMAVFAAAGAAGDEEAARLAAVAARAGVEILRYPVREVDQKPGQTMAIATMQAILDDLGEGVLELTLRGIRQSQGEMCGVLTGPILRGTAGFLAQRIALDTPEADLLAFLARVILVREADHDHRAERPRGKAVWSELADRLGRSWDKWAAAKAALDARAA